ncbi:MAG: endoribonuclease GhoS [Xanthomonadales bacterium PRO7]|nr:endoribonuclease GhoS [Xanthomonadales bacterium PRO7]
MSRFTVRVELHGATEADYQQLHAAMSRGGFSRVIEGSNGVSYHLPTAEYDYSSTETVSQVRDRAYAIACTVKQNPAVLVTEGGCAWKGLATA